MRCLERDGSPLAAQLRRLRLKARTRQEGATYMARLSAPYVLPFGRPGRHPLTRRKHIRGADDLDPSVATRRRPAYNSFQVPNGG